MNTITFPAQKMIKVRKYRFKFISDYTFFSYKISLFDNYVFTLLNFSMIFYILYPL